MGNKYLYYFERAILTILVVTVALCIAYATFLTLYLLYLKLFIAGAFWGGEFVSQDVQDGLYRVYASFLAILLGLELIQTVKVYFHENLIKLESILVISILALSRHIIQLPLEHVEAMLLIGIAALMGVLIVGYIMIARYLKRKEGVL